MNAYIDAMKKYGVFSGRTSRKDFWFFILIHYGIIVSLFIVSRIIEYTILEYPVAVFFVLYLFGTFVPNLAITVRRLHDISKSGAYIFVTLIPFAGRIWLLILLATKGTEGRNSYGENPDVVEEPVSGEGFW